MTTSKKYVKIIIIIIIIIMMMISEVLIGRPQLRPCQPNVRKVNKLYLQFVTLKKKKKKKKKTYSAVKILYLEAIQKEGYKRFRNIL